MQLGATLHSTPSPWIHCAIVKIGSEAECVNKPPALAAPGGSIKLQAEMHLEIFNENLIVHSTPAIYEDTPANQYKDH